MTRDFSSQTKAASSALDFFQRHPLRPPNDLLHVRRRPNQQLALATNAQGEPLARRSSPATSPDFERQEKISQDVTVLTDQVHSSLLLRMVGATLPTSARFALLLLLVFNAIIYIVTKRIGVRFLMLAASASLHFLILPFFTSALIQHAPSFSGSMTRLRSALLASPMSCLALWLQARLYAAFTACLFSAFGLDLGLGDTAVAALIGISLMCFDVLDGRYVCSWRKIVLQEYQRKRSWARDAVWVAGGTVLLLSTFDLGAKHAAPAALSLMRLCTAFFLSPSPSLGFALTQYPSRSPRLVSRLILLVVAPLWLQQWRDKSQAETEQALLSKTIATPGDLLLAMNSTSLIDQLIVNAHILSATEGAPDPLPVTNTISFVESDIAQYERGVPSGTLLRSTIAIPRKGAVGLHFGRHEASEPSAPKTAEDRNLVKNAHALPYKIARAISACVLPLLSHEVRSALAIMISESAGESYLANLMLYCVVPAVFEGKTPSAYTVDQIKVLTGKRRPTFVSVFGSPQQLVLSPEAAALTFGDQLFVSLVSRQESLVASLQRLFFVTELIQVTPPTGSFLPRGGQAMETKSQQNVFRYDASVRTELCRSLTDLRIDLAKTNKIFNCLAQEKKVGTWLIFGDGSIGLVKPDRQSLLTACQELLMMLVPQFLMAAEALLNISRIMQQLAPLDPSTGSSANLYQPWVNLKKYYPSADFNAPVTTEGPLANKLRTVLARAMTLNQMARDFAVIPYNPPYSVNIPDLTDMSTQLSIYLERWTKGLSVVLKAQNVEAERLVPTRTELRRILAKR